jgi:ElaB/YqjD/DUF883 family membrane-anchored ribosome-binding protein
MEAQTTANSEKWKKAVLKDVEMALDKAEGGYSSVSEKTAAAYESIKEKASETYDLAKAKAAESRERADQYVRENPEKSLLIAAGIGAMTALIAVWLAKRNRN